MRRQLIGLLAALALASAIVPSTALAAPSGATGSFGIPRPSCNVGNGFRDLYAPVPTIFAANRTAGSGNDRQAVYYWVRAYDYNTGTVLTDWVYGGGAWANDNSAAVFPAAGKFANQPYITNWRVTGPIVRLQYFVQWNTPAGAQLGTNDPIANSYQLWIFGTANQSGVSHAC